jgi:hypothetical protein
MHRRRYWLDYGVAFARGVGALWCALPAVLLSIVRSMTSRRDRVRV